MTIGIYSGSFDPIHTGHAIITNYLSQTGLVDKLWLMVSRHNPLKQTPTYASDADRIAMVKIVASRLENVDVCDFEFSLPYPSYTITTLRELSAIYPDCQFRLVIGADNWNEFSKWKDGNEIIRDYGIIIYPRPHSDIDPCMLPDNVTYLADAPLMEISSTAIRKGLTEGKNMSYFIPSAINDYITEHSLYR